MVSVSCVVVGLVGGAEGADKQADGEICKVQLKLLGNNTINNLLNTVMPVCEIVSFKEILPSMNDIFIQNVKEPV
jgi:ABC-2 type transport system ATP-binding protein